MTLIIKLHKSYRTVVALADKELLDKKFEEGKRQLDLTTTFYKGDDITEEKAIQVLQHQAKEDATLNIVGSKAVKTAKKAGILKEENISSIQNIPFALTLL